MYMRHGIVLSAIDSSTLNSSAMDSSAIGVDVAVLVVCKDLAARYLIFGVSDSTETFLTVSYCSQISMHVSTSYSQCSAEHVNHLLVHWLDCRQYWSLCITSQMYYVHKSSACVCIQTTNLSFGQAFATANNLLCFTVQA